MPNCSDVMCADPDCPRAGFVIQSVDNLNEIAPEHPHNTKRCGARKRRLIAKLKLAQERLDNAHRAQSEDSRLYRIQIGNLNEMIRPLQNALRLEAESHMRWRDSAHNVYEDNVKLEQQLREVQRDRDRVMRLLSELLEREKARRRPWWRRG